MDNSDTEGEDDTTAADSLHNCSILAVFEENYGLLRITIADIIDPVVKCFIGRKHLTVEEEEQITAITTTSEKIESLLTKISSLLKDGNSVGFYVMLKIMKEQGGKATQTLADHIINRLNVLADELSHICNYDQRLDDLNDVVKGYFSKVQRPQLKDIDNFVVIRCAPNWKQLGRSLDLDDTLLNIIEMDYPHDCERCCSKMLSEWLDLTPNASWKILNNAMVKEFDAAASKLPDTVKKLNSAADKLPETGDQLCETVKLSKSIDLLFVI